MTVKCENGEIVTLDGHGCGTVFNPEEEVTSFKLVGTTVVVNTREGHHYEYDGLTGIFDKERSSEFKKERKW